MEKILAPSILAADIMRLGEQIEAVKMPARNIFISM